MLHQLSNSLSQGNFLVTCPKASKCVFSISREGFHQLSVASSILVYLGLASNRPYIQESPRELEFICNFIHFGKEKKKSKGEMELSITTGENLSGTQFAEVQTEHWFDGKSSPAFHRGSLCKLLNTQSPAQHLHRCANEVIFLKITHKSLLRCQFFKLRQPHCSHSYKHQRMQSTCYFHVSTV